MELQCIKANHLKNDHCLTDAFNKIINYRYDNIFQKEKKEVTKELEKINHDLTENITQNHTDVIRNVLKELISMERMGVDLSADITFDKLMRDLIKYEYIEDDANIPENQFGLGYTNLVMIIAAIMDYMERYPDSSFNSKINLISIEEPETFMHPQMQELFIKNINEAIRVLLSSKNKDVNSQIIITTHSSHILNSKIHSNNTFNNMTLLWVYVPPTSTVEKCANRIYDRNEDGDMDITDSPIQLQNMYNRKSNTYAEHKIFPYVTTEDLRMDLMGKVRNLAKSKNPDHPWLKMSDDEIMKSSGLWEKDFSSGIQGYNLAGVLLFGKDDVIRSCCPGYITDALYRVENLDRYDDRLQVTTNLIEAYDLLMEFVAKHTSDKFCLINNISTSIRGIISREVIGNILVHRDYSSAYPAKVIIEKDWLRTENWCIPRRHGNIMSDEFTPYPKNPLIQQFFANIGRTDTIGSGVRNLYKYTPMYSDGGKPELIEDDVFRINIPLDRIAADEATGQKTLSEREQKIYNMICENLHLSVEQVMAELDISRSTVFRDYAKIKKVTGAVYDKKTSTWTL